MLLRLLLLNAPIFIERCHRMADAAATGSGKLGIAVSVFAIITIAINMYLMSKYTAESQNSTELKSATTWVTIVNAIFTLVLAAFASYYINANPSFGQTYFIIIAHLSLFLATTAMGVAVLTKA